MKRKLLLGLLYSLLLNFGITYGQEDCAGQFKTFTIGGWGTECRGGNPGCYRDANFASAFPNGLTIGCGTNTITLTSAVAVQNFLPSGGTPSLLNGTLINPLSVNVSNTLASQLVGVTLALGFDAYDESFSSNTNAFGELKILSGPHTGMTVAEFLDYANQVVGGCVEGSLTDLNETATNINENYDNGTVDNGYLDCNPCPNCLRFDFAISSTDALCNGQSNGTITINTSGGTAPYQYFFNDVLVATTNDTSYTFTGLAAGTYVVAVNDNVGNSGSSSPTVTVGEPSAIAAVVSKSDVSCFGGSNGTATIDNLSISGGTAPYSFVWSTGSTSNTISGLTAGNYSVTITDSVGCNADFNVTVSEPELLGYTASLTQVSCFGGSNGSATISANGGTSPYSIVWDNGSTAFTRGNLSANINYTAVITDANGCTTNVSVVLTQPTALTVTTATTQVLCYGGNGTATATPSGGTAPYYYSWNSNPVQTSATANLPVGNYSVTVTDANGCSVVANVTITILPCQGFTTVTMGGYGAKCSGGNWGCYLQSNFASKFPNGLTVGSGTRFLKFTTANAIQAFLPSGTTARALNAGTMTNPTTRTYNNVLAGQTVALTLSVAFDSNPNFSTSSTQLSSLIVGSGIFAGKSVAELLVIANTILGGGASPYTAAQINDALDRINRNYDNGTVNLGYLMCSCSSEFKSIAGNTSVKSFVSDIAVYPNPIKGNSTLEITLGYDSKVTVELYNINGQLVGSVFNGNLNANEKSAVNIDATNLRAGVYFLRVTSDRETFKKSVLVTE